MGRKLPSLLRTKLILIIISCLIFVNAYDDLIPEDDVEAVKEVLKKRPEYVYVEDNKDLTNGCNPKIPNLSVGDFFVHNTTQDFNSFKGNNTVFILALSDSACDSCCKGENLLYEVHQMFKAGDISYKGKQIPIVRVDINKEKDFSEIEDINFKNVPKLFLYIKGEYYRYDENFNLEFFLHFINRHLYPIVLLKTKEDVIKFSDVNQEWVEDTPFYSKKYYDLKDIFPKLKKVTRVIVFSTDKEECEDIKRIALMLAIRDDLRVAKVSKKELIKNFKKEKGNEWFGEYSPTSIVLFKKMRTSPSTKHAVYDLSTQTTPLYNWINNVSIEPLEELSGGSYKIGDLINKPMFLVFLNRNHSKYGSESIELYNILLKITPQYPQFLFMFTEERHNENKKRYLGITWREEPSMALNYMRGRGSIVFPRRKKFTYESVKTFIDSYIKGELEDSSTGLYALNNKYIDQMPTVIHADSRNYEKLCMKEGKDVLMLLYDAFGDEEENDMASRFFEKAANRFNELGIASLILVAYDIHENSMPPNIEFTEDLPQLIFFPAFHKAPPYRYFQDIRTEKLMKNVQDSADIKFELP